MNITATKEKIKEVCALHHKLCTGRDYTDEQFEGFFLTNYVPCEFVHYENDFFSYKDAGDHIWIQDFCSDNIRNSYRLLQKFESFKKRLKCQVPISNIKVLNIIIRKGFRIKDLVGYNYILER